VSAISTWHPARGIAAPVAEAPALTLTRSGAARWLVLAMGVVVLLGAGWWISNSPLFDLQKLEVRGNTRLTTKQITRLSGLTSETNVLWLSGGAVEATLERDPWIQDATVIRHLPSEVQILVTERLAAAVTAGEEPMLIATDGTVLGHARGSTELPSIVAPEGPLTVGSRLPVSAELEIVAALPDSVRPMVSTVTRQSDGSVALLTRDGITVLYGDASQATAKADTLRATLSWARKQGVHPTYVDVRAPTAPAIGTAAPVVPTSGD
jgi:cell division protein FtsQ